MRNEEEASSGRMLIASPDLSKRTAAVTGRNVGGSPTLLHSPAERQTPLVQIGSPIDDIVTVSAYGPVTRSRTVDAGAVGVE